MFKWKLFHRMTAVIALLLTAVTGVLAGFFYIFFSDSLEQQVGQNALNLAHSVAESPEIQAAFNDDHPSETIQPITERILERTGAEFIVVGNRQSVRYSHPEPDRIGETMIGGDNRRALQEGESYVSREEGSLGPSIRGKTPVFNENGSVIGVISVGFLQKNVNDLITDYSTELWVAFALLLLLGLTGAHFIVRWIKSSLFDLEPEEIAQLYIQKEGVLQAAHESIIAFDSAGNATFMNRSAEQAVSQNGDKTALLETLVSSDILETVLKEGRARHFVERSLAGTTMLLHLIPIEYGPRITGAVASFHPKNEVDRLNMELSDMRAYSETLRAQTHEFSNKLFTISGLLQMNEVDQATEYIQYETKTQQNRIHFFTSRVADPSVAGLLLGKYNQAYEKNITLTIHPDSSLSSRLPALLQHTVLTALGNVLDNAFEAVLRNGQAAKQVTIHFTDIGDTIIFEVDDNGPGLSEEEAGTVFERGISTKEESGHGYGLFLVKETLEHVNGDVYLEESEWGGACVVLSFPKYNEEERSNGEI
ncbi:ATP-binding protein [Salibacterium halotolerans]|uniref:histidine kinase n=1 Tax=Salibacterium halotolerans TaxID=1884432 RepID=A0A1I5LWD7_9BACI|nr:sensor histidine kinase [Salibacterium halotolerans]SFP01552.1 two-component system, CitB family, sensor kinase/two-component system, CitB family, sensor histidine kinase CitS [Salibacterium halotolerans]